MKKFGLNPEFVDVDYYSNSLHIYIKVFDISGKSSLIGEEELMISSEGQPCLVLQFKNSTGNLIILEKTVYDESETS